MQKRITAIFCIITIVLVTALPAYAFMPTIENSLEKNESEDSDKEYAGFTVNEVMDDEQNYSDIEDILKSEIDEIMEGYYEGDDLQHEQIVYNCTDLHEYINAGKTVNTQKVWSDVREIIINTKTGVITDQDRNPIQDYDPLIKYIEKNIPDNTPLLLENAGYEIVDDDDNELIFIDNMFQTKTLIVRSDEMISDDLALNVIHYGTYHELDYNSVKETAVSYRRLLSSGYDVMPSLVIEVDDPVIEDLEQEYILESCSIEPGNNDPMYFGPAKTMIEQVAAYQRDITVGIIDTGFYELDNNMISANRVCDVQSTLNDSSWGTSKHGSWVAHFFDEWAPENIGILALKATSQGVDNLIDTCNARIALGIAIENEVDVINMSFAAIRPDRLHFCWEDLFQDCQDNGIILVSVAGNKGNEDPSLQYNNRTDPGHSIFTICVGALDDSLFPSSYTTRTDYMDFAAKAGLRYSSDHYYTSFAAPYVTAAVAMMRCIDPNITQDECYTALQETAIDIYDDGKDIYSGWGMIQVYSALLNYLDHECQYVQISMENNTITYMCSICGNTFQKVIPSSLQTYVLDYSSNAYKLVLDGYTPNLTGVNVHVPVWAHAATVGMYYSLNEEITMYYYETIGCYIADIPKKSIYCGNTGLIQFQIYDGSALIAVKSVTEDVFSSNDLNIQDIDIDDNGNGLTINISESNIPFMSSQYVGVNICSLYNGDYIEYEQFTRSSYTLNGEEYIELQIDTNALADPYSRMNIQFFIINQRGVKQLIGTRYSYTPYIYSMQNYNPELTALSYDFSQCELRVHNAPNDENAYYLLIREYNAPNQERIIYCDHIEYNANPSIPGDNYNAVFKWTVNNNWPISSYDLYIRHNDTIGYKILNSWFTHVGFFTDVMDSTNTYTKAIYWAKITGVAAGYNDGTFGINQNVTRSQALMFLWRYAGRPEPDNPNVQTFTDVPITHGHYKAIQWAYENGIAAGYNNGTFQPGNNVTRGQIMMFIWRWEGKPNLPSNLNYQIFSDVPTNHGYFKAVNHCYGEGVFDGTPGTPMGVSTQCTRAEAIYYFWYLSGRAVPFSKALYNLPNTVV